MKLRFRVGSKQGSKEARKNGDIEALADAMRALKNIKNSNWHGTWFGWLYVIVMKLRFVVKNQTDERADGRTNGDIEALADARRALEKCWKIVIKGSTALDSFVCWMFDMCIFFFVFFSNYHQHMLEIVGHSYTVKLKCRFLYSVRLVNPIPIIRNDKLRDLHDYNFLSVHRQSFPNLISCVIVNQIENLFR